MKASSKLRRMCKLINAAMFPIARALIDLIKLFSGRSSLRHRHRSIYIGIKAAYIYLHIVGRRDHFGLTQSQSRTAQAKWWFEPPPRARSRSMVSKRRFLRCPRSGAGQIRDAPSGTHRGRREGGGGCPIRGVASDVLPNGKRLCTGRVERFVAEDARTQERAQAHRRSHALCRAQAGRRTSTRRPGARPADQGRTRPLHPPPQHRTRLGAEKKTVATGHGLPAAAVSAYETLRGEVLRGQARPEGLSAVVYHGMLDGLAMLMAPATPYATYHTPRTAPSSVRDDRAFLRLVANMILQTQCEVKHVY